MPEYLETEVSLLDITPRIWRRMLLKPTLSFYDLHQALQDAGPWENYHMWEFREWGRRSRETIAAMPGQEDFMTGEALPSADKVRLDQFFTRAKKKCLYVYDFGDNWEHEVQLRGKVDDPDTFERRLIAGKRAFPPEDCGGIPGYYGALLALGKIEPEPEHGFELDEEEAEERREWLGDWDPEGFDLQAMKRQFDRPKAGKRVR